MERKRLKKTARIEDPESDPRNVLTLLEEIREGKLEPKLVTAQERLELVRHLTGEGLQVSEIAKVLQRSDRSISRDRKAIRPSCWFRPVQAVPNRQISPCSGTFGRGFRACGCCRVGKGSICHTIRTG